MEQKPVDKGKKDCLEVVDFFNELPSPYPQIYENIAVEKDSQCKPVILVTGFSGSGKDTVLEPIFERDMGFHVTTATSRERREQEPETAYIWMRGKKLFEAEKKYYQNLVKEYVLIEYDYHYGNLYGLPLSSLKKEGRGVPIVRTDIHGIETLQKELPRYGYQPISVAIMPDTWKQVYESIMKRNSESPKDAQERLSEDIESSPLYSRYINFFLHNSREKVGDKSGLELSIEGMEYLIEKYK
jgi:guanylate kinase